MLSEWELWAVAQQVIEQRGDGAGAFADERISRLGAAGNERGVAVWTAVAARIGELQAQVAPRSVH